VPEPSAGELLVRVRAAGINNADLLQAAGHYPAPPGWPADILGMELAGEVVASGDGCTRFATGARVCAVVGGGAQAEFAIVPELVAMPLDARVAWDQAGAFPEAALTAWDALVLQGAVHEGHRVLVTGAAGGVGTIAVQIARIRGAFVIASTRHAEHDDALTELGAHFVIRPELVHEFGRFDAILELVGGNDLNAHLSELEIGGRIVYIGIGAGRHVDLDLLAVLQRRAIIRGSTLRSRTRGEHADLAHRVETSLLPHLASGELRVPIHARFVLDDIAAAHAEFRSGGKLGKLVLTI
jgi:NADPH:quinone reductase-like Zn-dependent oxidoreductase